MTAPSRFFFFFLLLILKCFSDLSLKHYKPHLHQLVYTTPINVYPLSVLQHFKHYLWKYLKMICMFKIATLNLALTLPGRCLNIPTAKNSFNNKVNNNNNNNRTNKININNNNNNNNNNINSNNINSNNNNNRTNKININNNNNNKNINNNNIKNNNIYFLPLSCCRFEFLAKFFVNRDRNRRLDVRVQMIVQSIRIDCCQSFELPNTIWSV